MKIIILKIRLLVVFKLTTGTPTLLAKNKKEWPNGQT